MRDVYGGGGVVARQLLWFPFKYGDFWRVMRFYDSPINVSSLLNEVGLLEKL
jgi:hypothetical protein